jgi:hypothetical protein
MTTIITITPLSNCPLLDMLVLTAIGHNSTKEVPILEITKMAYDFGGTDMHGIPYVDIMQEPNHYKQSYVLHVSYKGVPVCRLEMAPVTIPVDLLIPLS